MAVLAQYSAWLLCLTAWKKFHHIPWKYCHSKAVVRWLSLHYHEHMLATGAFSNFSKTKNSSTLITLYFHWETLMMSFCIVCFLLEHLIVSFFSPVQKLYCKKNSIRRESEFSTYSYWFKTEVLTRHYLKIVVFSWFKFPWEAHANLCAVLSSFHSVLTL